MNFVEGTRFTREKHARQNSPYNHLLRTKAGGMAFMRYDFDMNSTDLATWLREEHSVFLLAGDCYGMDRYFRIGVGAEADYLAAGLDRVRFALTWAAESF